MNVYGIERRIDDLGRIAIPKDFRKKLGIHEGDEMEIVALDDFIIIQKVKDTETMTQERDGS